jgi:hypothetical protein
MKKVNWAFVVVAAVISLLAVASSAIGQSTEGTDAKKQTIRDMVDADKDLVAVELKSGTVMVVRILKETKDQIFAQNALSNMEASFPRSKIADIRKPTSKELDDLATRLEEQKKKD